MSLKFALAGLALVFFLTGCIAHISEDTFTAVGPTTFRHGNKTFRVQLYASSQTTSHTNFVERTSALLYFRHRETGPYHLAVFVSTDGVENGTQLALTSATVQLPAGRRLDLLAKDAPPLVAVTAQGPGPRPDGPRDNSSRAFVRLPITDPLLLPAGQTLCVNLTVRISGEPAEIPLAVEYTHASREHWIPTPAIM